MENIKLGNRYKIIKQVGLGGMAKVYKAEDTVLKRIVAIKVLKDQFSEDDEFLRKFNNEAQSAAKLSDINIVNVYDIGQDIINGKNIYYIVMEFIEGITLKSYIDEKKILSNEEIENFSIQIASALNAAHSNGIIHRDIKPQNILMASDNKLKVTDFGIARVSSNATITYTNSILGTVHYISPEQAKGKFVDEKSDLYSLGVVMYEMATGKVPFDADNSVGIAIMHIQDEPVEPKKINPNLDEKLNSIIIKLLSKKPSDRFQNSLELIKALKDKNYNGESNFTSPTETIKIEKIKEENPKKNVYINNKNTEKRKEQIKKINSLKRKRIIKKSLFFTGIVILFIFFVHTVYSFFSPYKDGIPIPAVVDINEDDAIEILKNAGFNPIVKKYEENETVSEGKVIKQAPKAKTKGKKGDLVELTVSKGKKVTVPDLVGMSKDDAEKSLEKVGLNIGKVTFKYSEKVEDGYIIDQDPQPGIQLDISSYVNIVVSTTEDESSENNTIVPDLYNLNGGDAVKTIEGANLTVGSINYEYSDTIEQGNVISQSIVAGTPVEEWTTINIVISNGINEEENIQSSNVNTIFSLDMPNSESVIITIREIRSNGSIGQVFHDQVHYRSEANENNKLEIPISAPDGTLVEVLYDGNKIGEYTVH